jgi:hypothetical protein
MPRNKDVMDICDTAERSAVTITPDGKVKPKFDRTAYQRELMRKRRAAEKLRREK